MLSLCLFGFVILGLTKKGWKMTCLSEISKNLKEHKYLLLVSLVFFGVVFSGVNSSNMAYWMHHLQLKLPFLVLPLAFANAKCIDDNLIQKIVKGFLVIATITVLHTTLLYFSDMEHYNNMIAQGRSMPTPIQHVNYSLMLVFATSCTYFLYQETREKWLLYIGFAFFIFMHMLAVRTGLVAMYACIFLVAVKYGWEHKAFFKVGLVVLVCAIIPIMAYYTVPSFTGKIDYMIWDLTQLSQGNTADYSDGGRVISYSLGIDLFMDNVWMGTGIGDIYDQSLAWYQTNNVGFKGKLNFPHNQFLFSMASTGIVGLVIYQLAFLVPFFKLRLYKVPYVLILFTIIYISFLVETSLERSYGIVFFLFFFLLWGVRSDVRK